MPAYPEEYSRILDELVLLRAQTMYLAETSVGSARAAYVQAAAHLESAVTLLAALLGVQPPPAAPAYVRSPRALVISGILLLERVDNAMDTAVSPDARLAMTQLLRYLTQSLVQWIAVI